MKFEDVPGAINIGNEQALRRIIEEADADTLTQLGESLTRLHDVACMACGLVIEEMTKRARAAEVKASQQQAVPPHLSGAQALTEAVAAVRKKDLALEIHVPDNGKVH